MNLKSLFGLEKPYEDTAFSLYGAIVAQARQPYFFEELSVADTIEGRYDMMIMHAFLAFNRLQQQGEEAEALNQCVFDTMFKDIDQSLRESGVGDMGVGPRIRKMASAFYGRIKAYSDALEKDDDDELRDVIARNVFNKQDVSDDVLAHFASYMRRNIVVLDAQELKALMSGKIFFADAEE